MVVHCPFSNDKLSWPLFHYIGSLILFIECLLFLPESQQKTKSKITYLTLLHSDFSPLLRKQLGTSKNDNN